MEQQESLQKQKRVLQAAIEASSKRYEAQLVDKTSFCELLPN